MCFFPFEFSDIFWDMKKTPFDLLWWETFFDFSFSFDFYVILLIYDIGRFVTPQFFIFYCLLDDYKKNVGRFATPQNDIFRLRSVRYTARYVRYTTRYVRYTKKSVRYNTRYVRYTTKWRKSRFATPQGVFATPQNGIFYLRSVHYTEKVFFPLYFFIFSSKILELL